MGGNKKEPIAFDKYKYNVVGQYSHFNFLSHLIFSIAEEIFVSWCWAYNSVSFSTVQGLYLWTTLVRLINIFMKIKILLFSYITLNWVSGIITKRITCLVCYASFPIFKIKFITNSREKNLNFILMTDT